MLTELHGKGGRICQSALDGQLRCPLIVRPTSEDVVTGHLCQVLRVLNSRWWLPNLLNLALGSHRFQRQFHRNLKIDPWRNRPKYPREMLPWDEGSTQVDLTFQWDNPPTTVYVEMKYGSDLSMKTAGDDGQHGFPSDQLIRNVRVGLMDCGWFRRGRMFHIEPRDLVVILCCPTKGHRLVERYCDPERLQAAIPHSDRLTGLPPLPFIGELSYRDIVTVLRRQRCRFTRPERYLVDSLGDYLTHKAISISGGPDGSQSQFPLSP